MLITKPIFLAFFHDGVTGLNVGINTQGSRGCAVKFKACGGTREGRCGGKCRDKQDSNRGAEGWMNASSGFDAAGPNSFPRWRSEGQKSIVT